MSWSVRQCVLVPAHDSGCCLSQPPTFPTGLTGAALCPQWQGIEAGMGLWIQQASGSVVHLSVGGPRDYSGKSKF